MIDKRWTESSDGTLVAEASDLGRATWRCPLCSRMLTGGCTGTDKNPNGEIMGWRFIHCGRRLLVIND